MTHSNSRWMTENWSTIKGLPLYKFCMPGSHDSGMSSIHNKTTFSTEANTRTQQYDVGMQLERGIRYFDIRPMIDNGVLTTGHFSIIYGNFAGASGQNLDSIFDQINTFINDFPKTYTKCNELIFFELLAFL